MIQISAVPAATAGTAMYPHTHTHTCARVRVGRPRRERSPQCCSSRCLSLCSSTPSSKASSVPTGQLYAGDCAELERCSAMPASTRALPCAQHPRDSAATAASRRPARGEGGEGAPRQDEIWRCGQRLSGDSDEMRDAPIRSRREDAACVGPAAAMRARAGPLGVQTARADTDA